MPDLEPIRLPSDIQLAPKLHAAWMLQKQFRGFKSFVMSGEEMMVPYDELSEAGKEIDRNMARSILAIIQEMNTKGEI
jgi:hypothetical protein